MLQKDIFTVSLLCFYLQRRNCYSAYSKNFNLIYQQSQPLTHALLKQFYNGLILHSRFIEESSNLKRGLSRNLKEQLNKVKKQLDENIARLHHVVCNKC